MAMASIHGDDRGLGNLSEKTVDRGGFLTGLLVFHFLE
jgi:hypothetical protein